MSRKHLARYVDEHTFRFDRRTVGLQSVFSDVVRRVGAVLTVSVRRVYVQLASAFPLQELFHQVWRRLRALPTASG